MGLRQRHPHPDTWEIACDLCGTESSDASRASIESVAILEMFAQLPNGLWICNRVDEAHDAAAAALETGMVDSSTIHLRAR